MVNKKTVFVTIIILLVIFIPLTVVSFCLKNKINPFSSNPSHDFYYNNYLWFYDNEDNLLNKYLCNTSNCDFATSYIDDEEYKVNYYKEGSINKTNIIDNNYVFISDGALVNLYSIKTGSVLQSYKQIKTYNTKIVNDIYILQNKDDLWGVISINNIISNIIPFEYEYIGLINKVNETGELESDTFIGKKNNKWYLIKQNNSIVSSEFSMPIIDYNTDYIIVSDNDRIRVFNYRGIEYLTDYFITNYALVDRYLGIVSDNILYIYNNLDTTYLKSIPLSGEVNLKMELNGRDLIIKNMENVIDTIALY